MEDAGGYAKYELLPMGYEGRVYKVEDWQNATTPEDAAKAFCYIYFKPDENLSSTEENKLKTKAREYYELYAGKTIEEIAGVNETQLAIANVAQNSADYGIEPVKGYCLGWVADVYAAAGAPVQSANCARCAGNRYSVSQDFNNIPLGAAVYGESSSEAGVLYGHVAIYIGNGMVADNIGRVRITTLQEWIRQYPDGCWGWVSTQPVNASYQVNPGLIRAGSGSNCY